MGRSSLSTDQSLRTTVERDPSVIAAVKFNRITVIHRRFEVGGQQDPRICGIIQAHLNYGHGVIILGIQAGHPHSSSTPQDVNLIPNKVRGHRILVNDAVGKPRSLSATTRPDNQPNLGEMSQAQHAASLDANQITRLRAPQRIGIRHGECIAHIRIPIQGHRALRPDETNPIPGEGAIGSRKRHLVGVRIPGSDVRGPSATGEGQLVRGQVIERTVGLRYRGPKDAYHHHQCQRHSGKFVHQLSHGVSLRPPDRSPTAIRPLVPSTWIKSPVLIQVVAPCTLTTAGTPYSRATVAP